MNSIAIKSFPKTLLPEYQKHRGFFPSIGRPLKGELRHCETCRKEIYVRPYRAKRKGYGHYCLPCAKKEQSKSVLFAIKGLVTGYGEKYTVEEMFNHTITILVKYLKREPELTLNILLGDADKSFRIQELIDIAWRLCIEETLKCRPEFVEDEPGIFRLAADYFKTGG